jgi:hypothetical protein
LRALHKVLHGGPMMIAMYLPASALLFQRAHDSSAKRSMSVPSSKMSTFVHCIPRTASSSANDDVFPGLPENKCSTRKPDRLAFRDLTAPIFQTRDTRGITPATAGSGEVPTIVCQLSYCVSAHHDLSHFDFFGCFALAFFPLPLAPFGMPPPALSPCCEVGWV